MPTPPSDLRLPLEIVLWPDPVLLAGTRPVERVDDRLRTVVSEMRRVLFDLRGVGLAAPQVGVALRLMLVCPSGEPGDEQVVINPEVLAVEGTQLGEEGCLSFPGIYGRVQRSLRLRLRHRDLDWRVRELDLDGFVARIVQHEADHLDGRVFVDRMEADDRRDAEPDLARLRERFASQGGRSLIAGA